MSTNHKKTDTPCADCFKSLSVGSRYKIYAHLKNNSECTVTELVDLVGLTQPTVSYHLHDMKDKGLLSSRKTGKEVYYSINPACPHGTQECVLSEVKFRT